MSPDPPVCHVCGSTGPCEHDEDRILHSDLHKVVPKNTPVFTPAAKKAVPRFPVLTPKLPEKPEK